MPNPMMTEPGMDELYSQSSSEDQSEDTAPKNDQEEPVNTAVVSNSVLMGPDGESPQEGDEITVRVVRVYGEESEIEYAPAKSASREGQQEMTADEEFDSIKD
jgi:hypothetical protein